MIIATSDWMDCGTIGKIISVSIILFGKFKKIFTSLKKNMQEISHVLLKA